MSARDREHAEAARLLCAEGHEMKGMTNQRRRRRVKGSLADTKHAVPFSQGIEIGFVILLSLSLKEGFSKEQAFVVFGALREHFAAKCGILNQKRPPDDLAHVAMQIERAHSVE